MTSNEEDINKVFESILYYIKKHNVKIQGECDFYGNIIIWYCMNPNRIEWNTTYYDVYTLDHPLINDLIFNGLFVSDQIFIDNIAKLLNNGQYEKYNKLKTFW